MSDILYEKKMIKKTIIYGCLLRFAFLLIVISLKNYISPYALSDDEHYEDIATTYFKTARTTFDFTLATMLHFNDLLQFLWTYIVCFTSKIFGTIYGARIFNCLISTTNIYIVYQLTKSITKDAQISLRAARLYAYIPFAWMFCVFPFKDTFLSCCVLYVLWTLVQWQNYESVGLRKIAITVLCCSCIFFTRGAVVEFLVVTAICFLAVRYYQNNKRFKLVLLVLLSIIIIIYLGSYAIEAADKKVEDYGNEDNVSSGMLGIIQVKSLSDLWKFPLSYMFALFQPIALKITLFDLFSKDNWSGVIGLCNIATYPIAFGNMAYVFCKKHNAMFWAATFVMYGAVICLSLGTFRHYMFLYPVLLINYACVKSYNSKKITQFIKTGSILFFLLIIIMSFR